LPTDASSFRPASRTLPTRGSESAWDCAAHCPVTTADGYDLTEDFFSGDRAMRESGLDAAIPFGPFGGSTKNFASVSLNALLFKYEHDLAFITATLGDTEAAVAWSEAAGQRRERIDNLLWDETAGLYFDFDFINTLHASYRDLTSVCALWSGVATPEQAQRLADKLLSVELRDGLQMNTTDSGAQWVVPFGWAPTNWLAVSGLARYGYTAEARRIALQFTSTVDSNYARNSIIRENYDVKSPAAGHAGITSNNSNVIGFTWTNAVYRKMQQFLASAK